MIFADVAEVQRAYENKVVDLHAKIKVRMQREEMSEAGELVATKNIVETTVGRAILAEVLPKGLPFELVNQPI